MRNASLESDLVRYLKEQQKDFVSLSSLKRMPKALRKALGITGNDSASAIAKRIAPHVGERLEIRKGSRSRYLAFRQPTEVFVYNRILERPGQSPGQHASYLPMKKAEFLEALNLLLARGDVYCTVTSTYGSKVYPTEIRAPSGDAEAVCEPAMHAPQDDQALFLRACDRLDRGQDFFRIHELRNALGWTRERFDRLLEKLRDEGTIALHAGDMSTMTEAEVRASYVDENNFFLATLTRKQT